MELVPGALPYNRIRMGDAQRDACVTVQSSPVQYSTVQHCKVRGRIYLRGMRDISYVFAPQHEHELVELALVLVGVLVVVHRIPRLVLRQVRHKLVVRRAAVATHVLYDLHVSGV